MNPLIRLLLLGTLLLTPFPARAVVGLSREKLIRVYGPIQEEAKSVYGEKLIDLFFVARSTADGNSIIVAATMMEGQCHAISYLKNDQQGQPAPLTAEEVRNQMVASSRSTSGVWKQVREKEWRLDAGPDMASGLKAQWTKPELFQVFTEQMLARSTVKP